MDGGIAWRGAAVGWLIVGAALLGALLSAGPARAQTPALEEAMPGTEFAQLTFQQAREEAWKKRRLLMVYVYVPDDINTAEMERRTWRNPTLGAYTLWHAVAIKLTIGEAAAVSRCARPTRSDCGGYPKYYVFRDTREPKPGTCPTLELVLTTQVGRFARMDFGLMGDAGQGRIPDFPPTPLMVLLRTDMVLEGLRARDPIWSARHDHLNPEPPRPPPSDPFYQVGDDGAMAIEESTLGHKPGAGADSGKVVVDVLDQLEQARLSAGDEEWPRAIGLYTWLWERGEQFDPSFRTARRSIVAGEMRALAETRPAARDRFARLRDDLSRRLRWADRDELTEWFILNGIVGDIVETIAYYDLATNDEDEGAMLPTADRAAYKLMMTREGWVDPWQPVGVGTRPLAEEPWPLGGPTLSSARRSSGANEVRTRMGNLEVSLGRGRPTLVPPDQWKPLAKFRQGFAVEEACRLHAACLHAGLEQEAWEMCDTLLRIRGDSASRYALVTTALAAGEARPRHMTLLNEAEKEGTAHSTLREHLDRMLKDKPSNP